MDSCIQWIKTEELCLPVACNLTAAAVAAAVVADSSQQHLLLPLLFSCYSITAKGQKKVTTPHEQGTLPRPQMCPRYSISDKGHDC